MALEKIIAALENLDGPDRKIDQSIALQVGYTLSINQGLLTGERDQKVWWLGSPPKEVRLPAFTKNIDAALHLANLVGSDKAPTAAIAICLAAMRKLRETQ